MKHVLLSLSALALLAIPNQALAQMDEIIVTGQRIVSPLRVNPNRPNPGIFLEQKGDFLLLEVQIENDSRNLSERLSQISDTVDDFLTAAENNADIELSIVDENNFVRPLSEQNYREGITGGSRPDTSVAILKVKTKIPDRVEDSYKLAQKLSKFVDSIDEKGRITINTSDQVLVSVVDPYQYRPQVQMLLVEEINRLSEGLGPNYRAIIRGLDGELKWVRSGDLNLAFYIPYTYDIVPDTLHSYKIESPTTRY